MCSALYFIQLQSKTYIHVINRSLRSLMSGCCSVREGLSVDPSVCRGGSELRVNSVALSLFPPGRLTLFTPLRRASRCLLLINKLMWQM